MFLGLSSLMDALGDFSVILIPIFLIVAVALVIYYASNRKVPDDTSSKSSISSNSEAIREVSTPKVKNPYLGINAMLLVGSALLVVAVISFTHNADDRFVAPVAIFLTLLFYVLGVVIYKKIDYLKIVGKAFTYISLAIFPVWVISFNFFGLSWKASWILSSIITLAALLSTAFIYKTKFPAYLSYIWLYVVAFAATPEVASVEQFNLPVYWIAVWSGVIALIPAALWKKKPQWLPLNFRRPTKEFGTAFMIVVSILSLILYFIPDTIIHFPFLRTIMVCFFLAWIYIYWTLDHSYSKVVAIRFAAQAFLLTIAMDALNFSIIPTINQYTDATRLAVISIWIISFLAQTMLSLFIPKQNEEQKKIEHNAEVVSLIGIFVTPLLTIGLESVVGTAVRLITCIVIAILGICYVIVHKNIRWSIATILALIMGHAFISDGSLIPNWNSWADLIYYTLIASVAIMSFQLFRKYNEDEGFIVTMIELVGCLFFVVTSAMAVNYAEIGWLIVALFIALIGFMTKKVILYEISIYCGAFSLYGLSGTVGELMLPEEASKCITDLPLMTANTCTSSLATQQYINWIAGVNVVRSFLLGGALTAVSCIKERNVDLNRRYRLLIGYFIVSLGLYLVGLTAGGYWMLFCLAVQVAYLIIAAIHDIEWMVWVTIIAMPICALSLTGGFNYLWFAILGLTLIGVVIWRLSKLNRAKLREEARAGKKPEAPRR